MQLDLSRSKAYFIFGCLLTFLIILFLSTYSSPHSAKADADSSLAEIGTIAWQDGDLIKTATFPDLIVPHSGIQGTSPQFLADGSRLFYQNEQKILSQLPNGGDEQTHVIEEGFSGYFDMTPDGEKFAAAHTVAHIYAFPLSGLCFAFEPTIFENGEITSTQRNARTAEISLSADGRWMVYSDYGRCSVSGERIYDIPNFCVKDLLTDELQCIEEANYTDPDFAPTGSALAFTAVSNGQREVWTAEVQADRSLTNLVQVTHGGANQPAAEPAFSTNGEWIIYQRDIDPSDTQTFELFIVKTDGSMGRSLGIQGTYPTWSNGLPDSNPPVGELNEDFYLPLIGN